MRTVIPRPILSAKQSAQIIAELARHKSYNLLQIKPHSEWDWGECNSDINRQSALSAIASERTIMLAQTKSSHRLYCPSRAGKYLGTMKTTIQTDGQYLGQHFLPSLLLILMS